MFRNYHADISDLEWSGIHYQKGEGSLWSQTTLWGRQGPSNCQNHTRGTDTANTKPLEGKRIVSRTFKKKIKVNMSTMQCGVVG